MSLYDIFLTNAAREHQNMLNKNNTEQVMVGLSRGVLDAIEEEKQKKLKIEEQNKSIERMKKIGSDNKSKITTTIDEKGTSYKIESGDNADDLKVKREKRLADQTELRNATTLRQEFINRPEVKDYVATSTSVNAMDSLYNQAVNGGDRQNRIAIDQGLITMYNKLTDPTSVVRESEYARTPGNMPLVNRIIGAMQKLGTLVQDPKTGEWVGVGGGAGLTNDDRKALVEGAKIIQKERGAQYNNTLSHYEQQAIDYGLKVDMVTNYMKPFETINKEFNTVEEAEAANLPIGTEIRINGKRAVVE